MPLNRKHHVEYTRNEWTKDKYFIDSIDFIKNKLPSHKISIHWENHLLLEKI